MTERPQIAEPRDRYIYRPGTQTVAYFVGPKVLNRAHSITADAEIPTDGGEGVLLCQGSAVGGWSFYMLDGRLHYAHNYVRRAIYHVCPHPNPYQRATTSSVLSSNPPPPRTSPTGKGSPGRAQLYIDGTLVAETDMPVTTPVALNPGGLTCGANPGSPVTPGLQGARSTSPASSTA